jgi:hypothetical protein
VYYYNNSVILELELLTVTPEQKGTGILCVDRQLFTLSFACILSIPILLFVFNACMQFLMTLIPLLSLLNVTAVATRWKRRFAR